MEQKRYTAVAIALHWSIAILIIGQIAGGIYMHNLPNSSPIKFDLFQLHKSFGISLLVLTLIRLGWRLTHKPPSLPQHLPSWQKFAARLTHWAFYILLILTPLAGWAMVSVSPLEIPTFWFGVFEWPHLPFGERVADRAAAEDIFKERHEFLAFSILFLLALHIGAALKHAFVDRDGVLRSMVPGVGAIIGVAFIFTGLLGGVILYNIKSELIVPVTAPLEQTNSPASGAGGAPEVDVIGSPSGIEEPVVESVSPEDHSGINGAEEAEPTSDNGAPQESPEPTPAIWEVDYARSSLAFSGNQNGNTFSGRFSDFSARIEFSSTLLDQSSVSVDIKTSTAATADELRDVTLPTTEWFDADDHPEATFRSTDIRRVGGESYEMDGLLTIKDIARPITIPFTLKIEGDEAHAIGSAEVVRTDFELGANSTWLDQEGVGLNVTIEFEIFARRE